MNVLDDVTMHGNNRRAREEDATWLEDVGRWEAEHTQVAAWLREVQTSWDKAEAALESHARVVRAHEQRIQRHERAIKDHWQEGSNFEHKQLATDHEKLRAKHLQAQAVHEQLKHRHETVTAEILELLKLTTPGALVQETLA